jgi:hypothetical protein
MQKINYPKEQMGGAPDHDGVAVAIDFENAGIPVERSVVSLRNRRLAVIARHTGK